MGTGFLIHQLKSRTVACLGAVLWISALLYGIPSLFLLGSAELSGFDNVAKLIALIFAALGTLISIGGLRATFRFHQLKSGEE